jgi:hypothetical protein
MSIREVSWLDFVGLAVAVSQLESAITGVGVTILKDRRTSLAGDYPVPPHSRTNGIRFASAGHR